MEQTIIMIFLEIIRYIFSGKAFVMPHIFVFNTFILLVYRNKLHTSNSFLTFLSTLYRFLSNECPF